MDRRSLSLLFGPGTPLSIEAALPDSVLLELLANPVADRPGAFAEVARRYGSLVWAVCRRSLHETADAEDAFQATLVALLEHLPAASRARSLPAWLHGVALRVCLKLKRTDCRRRGRDGKAARPESTHPVADATWHAARQALDEEVARLPASLRTAFLTCALATEPQPELAARLGWTVGTLSARYSRARRRLEARLVARNLVPALGGVGLVLSAQSTSAVPWRLADAVLPLIQTPVVVPAIAPVVLFLAKEGAVMGLSKLKLLALGGVAAVGVGLNVGPALLPPVEAQVPGGGVVKVADPPPSANPAATDTPEFAGVKWEYEFVPLPAKPADARKLLTDKGAGGWEYAGTLGQEPVGVFKRQKAEVRPPGTVTRRRFTELQERPGAKGETRMVPVEREEVVSPSATAWQPQVYPPLELPTTRIETRVVPLPTPRSEPFLPPPLPGVSVPIGNPADRIPPMSRIEVTNAKTSKKPELSDAVLDLPGDLATSLEFQKLLAGLLERGPNAGVAPQWAVVGNRLILIDVDTATVTRVKKLIEPFAKDSAPLG